MRTARPLDKAEILRQAHEWRFLLEHPEATAADHAAFAKWKAASPHHADLYDQAVTFYEALGTLEDADLEADVARSVQSAIPFVPKPSPAWGKLLKGLPAFPSIRIVSVGVAVLAAVFAGIAFFMPGQQPIRPIEGPLVARYETGLGETRDIELSDGTVLTLGAASQIETRYSATARTAILQSGGVFLTVRKDPSRPFTVYAGDFKAKVLGTAFDLTRSAHGVRLAVAEGTVEVSYPLIVDAKPMGMDTRQTLTQGQQIVATQKRGLEDITSISLAAIGAWREEKLFYDGARLGDLVADANRYSAARVVIEDKANTIANFRVRGAFNARDIDGMLSNLEAIYPVVIDRNRVGVIVIRSKK